MPRISVTLIAGATAAILIASGCGGDDDNANASADASAVTDLPRGSEPVALDPGDFTTEIDNRFWPMQPGTQWIYRETDEEGTKLEVVVTVTTATMQTAIGITARVVRDTVTEDGELVEDTFDWYAQDADGNVWYLGEDTAEFQDGEVTSSAGSWEAGVDGALAGVIMPAEPADDMRYRQEYYEGEAEDNGEVLAVGEQVDVAAGHYDDVLLTKDTSALEPDVLEYKLYAPDVGPVLALGISGGPGREELLSMTDVGSEIAQAAGTIPLGSPLPHSTSIR